MYLRFECPTLWDDASRCCGGIFMAMYGLEDRPDLAESWQVQSLTRHYTWFMTHLNVPRRLHYKSRKARHHGVCWFRDSASEHISRARDMAWLLGDLGIPIEPRRSRSPGRILWEDAHQVVASPHLM